MIRAFHFIVGVLALSAASASAEDIAVSNLKDLQAYAAKSGNTVTLIPGVYKLTDHIRFEDIAERRKRGEWPFFVFSGSNNTFNFTGVTIEYDTQLRKALRPPVHTNGFVLSGNGNTIDGLTILCSGAGTAPGGALFHLAGNENTVRGCEFHVQGSHPYGYGDLFGKSHGTLKHSGFLVTGSTNRILGCKLFMRSFGHGFFIQKNAEGNHFEDCVVEGVMRSTDEMLAETKGFAFDRQFKTEFKNRAGQAVITRGYMKCLAEDGFRTYDEIKNLTLKNCTAKNMRGGFELRTPAGARMENCTAIGCERGIWVGSKSVVENGRADAQFGPALYVEGDGARVDLTLLPTETATTVHQVAAIHGKNHTVTLRTAAEGARKTPLPILLGYSAPPAGENAAPLSERPLANLTLRNETASPVLIGKQAQSSRIQSRGPLLEDAGKANQFEALTK